MNKEELWEELKFEIGNLERLKNITEEEIILGSGNKNGSLLFIGDDNKLYEDEDLRFEIGSSGEFFIKLCDLAEISPKDYFITTLTKQELRFRDLFEEEQIKILELLDMQISLLSPKVIIFFGQSVAEAVLKKEVNMGKERGKFYKWKGGIEFLITYDVEYIKKVRENTGRKSKAALEFWKDLQNIKNKLEQING
ncbi:MAG: uracil-DNA glycosylase family protein [Fusobacterium sp. JB021]|nr:uracil-DNA glycosylase family protein [Fusobacterium sp. JB020]MDP0494379.1 uracil-DNA glycosylase family protein [Fusobacterium sp. JB021]MDP0506731.1 uracil-DNA glycosylase family protein [Fusobacterium sp. JB019]